MSFRYAGLRVFTLREMFWDAISEGGIVVHPTLGKGIVIWKKTEKLRRAEYSVKLIKVRFDTGQTCVFHSRVKDSGEISESLAAEVMRALDMKDSLF